MPLVSEKPLFHSLTVEGGVRYSDYKVDAPGNPTYNTFTFKAGGTWEPVEGLAIRGNYARAVRAPNIGELFAPVNTGLTNLGVDPCATLTTAGTLHPVVRQVVQLVNCARSASRRAQTSETSAAFRSQMLGKLTRPVAVTSTSNQKSRTATPLVRFCSQLLFQGSVLRSTITTSR